MTTLNHALARPPAAARNLEAVFADETSTTRGHIDRTWRSARSDSTTWVRDVVAALAPGQRAVAVLSFEPDAPALAHRLLANQVLETGSSGLIGSAQAGVPARRRHRVHADPSPGEYADAVRSALARIEAGTLEKVVLGRSLQVLSDPPLAPEDVLANLAGGAGHGPAGRYLFSVPLGPQSGGRLIGASPELLVRRRGSLVEAMPLAGSSPRHPDPDQDEQRRRTLGHSTKDRAEHDFVVADLVARLRSVCTDVQAGAVPEVVSTDTMWHLGTRIRATLADEHLATPRWSALGLAQLVHPTPAVGGVPRAEAMRTIRQLEGQPRGWFAGSVGWVDSCGDGEFALTLRSGVLDGNSLRLWAGAGIVAGSIPEAEVAETGAKLATMTRAVGL